MGRTYLHCLLCGFETSEVDLPASTVTRAALRAALSSEPATSRPVWDAALTPRCPRCDGRLLLGSVPSTVWFVDDPGTFARSRRHPGRDDARVVTRT